MTRAAAATLLDTVGQMPVVRFQRWGGGSKFLALIGKLSPGGSIHDVAVRAVLQERSEAVTFVGDGLAAVSAAALSRLAGRAADVVVHPPHTAELLALARVFARAVHVEPDAPAARTRATDLKLPVVDLELDPHVRAAHRTGTGARLRATLPPGVRTVVAPAGSVAAGLADAFPKSQVWAARVTGFPGGDGPVPEADWAEIIEVPATDAWTASRELAATEGLHVGVSAGAVAHAARRLGTGTDTDTDVVALVLPDGGERYYSVGDALGSA